MSVPSLQAPFAPVPAPTSSGKENLRFRFWHETLIDLMIQHPEWNNTQLAQAVGKGPVTVGYVTRSDMFRARFAERRREHSERISYSIIAQTQGIAQKALKQLDDKLEDNSVQKKISARDLHEIAADALDRIGLGPKPADIVLQTNVQQNNTSITVSSDALLRARQKLRNNEAVLDNRTPSLAFDAGSNSSIVDVIVNEESRSPILDELMTIGDDVSQTPSLEGESVSAASVAPVGTGEG